MSGLAAVAALAVVAATPAVRDATLVGSPRSLDRQNATAEAEDTSRLTDGAEVRRFVRKGLLVEVKSTRDLEVSGGVTYPFARPALKLLLDRLAAQYRRACKERLVVTSLVRPKDQQEAGQSPRSVHSTGLAADLRASRKRRCRVALESTLLYLEARALAEATREYTPPHYHVAVAPTEYEAHVRRRDAEERKRKGNRRRRRGRR